MLQQSKQTSVKKNIKLEILQLSIWIKEVKSDEVREIIYTCNSTSGHLILTSVILTS